MFKLINISFIYFLPIFSNVSDVNIKDCDDSKIKYIYIQYQKLQTLQEITLVFQSTSYIYTSSCNLCSSKSVTKYIYLSLQKNKTKSFDITLILPEEEGLGTIRIYSPSLVSIPKFIFTSL